MWWSILMIAVAFMLTMAALRWRERRANRVRQFRQSPPPPWWGKR
jgi:hypothetical protein